MANKRMFSKDIVDSDAFLDMPQSTQLLYFQLSMRADDEGFVGSPRKIMRMCGLGDDDLKILKAKRFILTFESGVVVIKHWLIHNTIRMDRFKKTTYQKEKKQLKVAENKGYTEVGNQTATIRQPKLSKVKLSKVKLSKDRSDFFDKNHTHLEVKNKTLKEFRDAKRKQAGKPPMTPRKQTDKQKATMEAFRDGIEYFKEQGYDQHGMQFLKVNDQKRNQKLRKAVGYANEKIDNLKELVDWWFGGEGEWASYEPEACFSNRTIERFINREKLEKDMSVLK